MSRPDDDFGDAGGATAPGGPGLEVPDEDRAEQAVPANPADEQEQVRRGDEVDEYDAVEQARIVDLDDDYR